MNSRNYLKTTLLLATMSAIVLLIGSRFAGGAYLPLALAFAVLMNGIAYFFSDKIAILSARAKPVTEAEFPELYRIVRGLAGRAGMPMPRLYVSPSQQPNAFATAACLGHPADPDLARARGRARPRAVAREEPGHPDLVGGRDHGRDHHVPGAPGLVHPTRWRRQGPEPARRAGAGDPWADRRAGDPDGGDPQSRVRRRFLGCGADRRSARAGQRPAQDRGLLARNAAGDHEPVHRAPVHLQPLQGWRRAGQAVLHPPADSRARRPARGDGLRPTQAALTVDRPAPSRGRRRRPGRDLAQTGLAVTSWRRSARKLCSAALVASSR